MKQHGLSVYLLIIFALVQTGCSIPSGEKDKTEGSSMLVTLVVRALPSTETVDFTGDPLPPLQGATITVWESDNQGVTDRDGKSSVLLALGNTPGLSPGEGVYTFEITHPQFKYRTIVRRRLTADEVSFEVHYNSQRDVFSDWSTQVPQMVATKVTVQQRPADTPLSVDIEETGQRVALDVSTDTTEVLLPEGFYTVAVSTQGSPYRTRVRAGVFFGRSDSVQIQFRPGMDSYVD